MFKNLAVIIYLNIDIFKNFKKKISKCIRRKKIKFFKNNYKLDTEKKNLSKSQYIFLKYSFYFSTFKCCILSKLLELKKRIKGFFF